MPARQYPTKEKPLWRPTHAQKEQSALWQFASQFCKQTGISLDDYDAIHAWSIAEPEEFYTSLWEFLGIIGEKGHCAYMPGSDLKSAHFYPGARLNYAENLLDNPDDSDAIIAHRDDGSRRSLTRRQLYDEVSRLVQALQHEGLSRGDRVVAVLTNDLEAIIAYLAVSAIGAVWSSCSPDFGPSAAGDRLCQVKPTILLANACYRYGDKDVDVNPTIKAIAENSQLKRIVIVGETFTQGLSEYPVIHWDDYLSPWQPAEITFTRLPYDAPLAILFSSGTTGKPKCIVHSAMGLLIQHKKEHVLHCDLKSGERFFYFTTCGWMMWNWQISGLASGATLVTYDGNPFHPAPDRLLQLIEGEKINVFGTSAKYISSCESADLTPVATHDFSSLRLVLSTGSPLLPANFEYIYKRWKENVHLASISGGTDICGCFLGGNPLLPVHSGELQSAFLGMDIDTLDDAGNSISGRPGELVCRNAHLSIPLGFLEDSDGSTFHDAYFQKFSDIWAHGDFVEKTPVGGYVIHGRSDTTLNPGGVRIGTAEIYRQVEHISEIEDSIVVGQDWKGDQRIILFVCLQDTVELDEKLIDRIKTAIRTDASPRHVPAKIIAVNELPRTRSGKISEIAVRNTIHGQAIKNTYALANPDCLAEYTNLRALQS